jgi:hypothetical protein
VGRYRRGREGSRLAIEPGQPVYEGKAAIRAYRAIALSSLIGLDHAARLEGSHDVLGAAIAISARTAIPGRPHRSRVDSHEGDDEREARPHISSNDVYFMYERSR